MFAKGFWKSWALLCLTALVVLQISLLLFTTTFIVPKFMHSIQEGMIDPVVLHMFGESWMIDYLRVLGYLANSLSQYLIFGMLAVWVLFEWRVKSEHKPFIRLSALGTLALVLFAVVCTTAAALVLPYQLCVPWTTTIARPYVNDQIDKVDVALKNLEPAILKKDWILIQAQVDRAQQALNRLMVSPYVLPYLRLSLDTTPVDEIQARINTGVSFLEEADCAIQEKEFELLQQAIKKFQSAYKPLREAAVRPQQ